MNDSKFLSERVIYEIFKNGGFIANYILLRLVLLRFNDFDIWENNYTISGEYF